MSEKNKNILKIVSVPAVALAAVALASSQDADPTTVEKTYQEHAQDAAQTPYDPATDELVIDNIRVKPNNDKKNNPSQAVLNDARVQDYADQHPEESTSLTASSMALSSHSNEFVVVKRDIDNDGDTDAVAVSAK